MGPTFVEETLLPIPSPASALRPPSSFLPLGVVPGTGPRLDLPSPAQRDSLGSDTEWGGVYAYQLELRDTTPIWTWSALWRCWAAGLDLHAQRQALALFPGMR